MVPDPFIVFFDTFTHNGQVQENVDCVRFKSAVELIKICILPFGSVVESNLSDEPLLGATNPAKFDFKVYSNSQTNCVVLQSVASSKFNEKRGINTIFFDKHVQSNFILFRGHYSTLTVALFGLPTLSMGLPPMAPSQHLAIPFSSVNLIKPVVTSVPTSTPGYYGTVDSSIEHASDVPATWSRCSGMTTNPMKCYPQSTTMDTQSQQSVRDFNTVQSNSEPNYDAKVDENVGVSTSEAAVTYEDGEIQDIDYDEISSNEEFFSEIEDDGEQQQQHHLQQSDDVDLTEISSQLDQYQWKFNLYDFIERYTHGPLRDHRRISDSTFTLFQLHCWLLERAPQKELHTLLESQNSSPHLSDEINEVQTDTNASALLPPPRDDWIEANQSANYLVNNLLHKFGSLDHYNEEWIEVLENIGVHLAPGLAYLQLTDPKLFQDVIQNLIHWVYSGVDMNLALQQTDSSYIVRHLVAGVNIAGMVTGTVNSAVASTLLYPTEKSEDMQLQHLLLNLLESPLITTPLRMGICHALDQTMRLPIGLESFLGINHSMQNACDTRDIKSTQNIKSEPLQSPVLEKKHHEEASVTPHYLQDSEMFDNRGLGDTVSTPYQRFLCIVAANKNSRVTAAYQRLLNKVHFYELLTNYQKLFSQFVDKLDEKYKLDNPKFDQSECLSRNWFELIAIKQTLLTYLKEIINVIENADEIMANPRNSLPCPLLLNENKLNFHCPYPDLYTMLDFCGILESVATMIEFLQVDNYNYTFANQTQPSKLRDFLPTTELSCVMHKFISILCGHSFGLQLLASRPDTTLRIIKACLNCPMEDEDDEEDLVNVEYGDSQLEGKISNLFLIGLELSFKLEALYYVDVLVSWTRRKGVAGVYSFATQLHSDITHATEEHERQRLSVAIDTGDCTLRDALLGLCYLCLHNVSSSGQMSNFCGFTSTNKLASFINLESMQFVLCSSAPVWIAEVLVMDDYFSSILMLLEAFAENDLDHNTNASINVNQIKNSKIGPNLNKVMSLDKMKPLEDDAKTIATCSPVNEQPSGFPTDISSGMSSKTLIHNQLCGPVQLSGLVNTLMLVVLRHSENVTYLDRYGPRLVQLLPAATATDNIDDSPPPFEMFSRLNSFSRLVGNYLCCLRRDSTKFNLSNLLNMPPNSPLTIDAALNLINQLKPLSVELSDALDNLSSLELTDELLYCQNGATSGQSNRRASTNNQLVAGHLIRANLLVLLRLLRAHILGPNSHDATDNLFQITNHPEKQIILSRSQILIELHSSCGFNILTTIMEKLSSFFILKCEATFQLSHHTLDLVDISTCNANVNIIFALFDSCSQLISALLQTIIHVQGSKYYDTNLWKSLFKVYACTVYVYCAPGPKLNQLKRIRSSIISSLLVYEQSSLSKSLNMQDVNKSIWVSLLRELVHFTISSPCFYIPGLKIFLDLLPLSLPIITVEPLDTQMKTQLLQSRDLWAIHLVSLSTELISLIELLGCTNPLPSNLLYCCLSMFVKRLVDLGLPFATLLANSCLDSLTEVYGQLYKQLDKQERTTTDNTFREIDNLSSSSTQDGGPTNLLTTTSPTLQDGNVPNAKLLLLFKPVTSGSDDGGLFNSDTINGHTSTKKSDSQFILNNNIVNSNVSKDSSDTIIKKDFLSKLSDSSELTSVLSFVQLVLSVPQCKYAMLDALRLAPSSRRDENDSNTVDDACTGEETNWAINNNTRRVNFCNILKCLLSDCSDKASHINTQLKVLNCVRLLVDPKSITINSTQPSLCINPFLFQCGYHDELQFLTDNLPDVSFLKELVVILVKHINHPDRDLVTVPNALEPLVILTEHDVGFWIVKEVLDSPVAFSNGQHLFANLVQRVNDCFSVDSPDCQATLTGCLRLIQSLLVTDPHGSSLTFFTRKFANSNRSETPFDASVTCGFNKRPDERFKRTAHISGDRVRELLGWSGSRDEAKPVRDLHALLEMLADDEPSLEYLRSGMKNLLALLSNEFDMSDYKEFSDLVPQVDDNSGNSNSNNVIITNLNNNAPDDRDSIRTQSGSLFTQPRSAAVIFNQFEKFLSLKKINTNLTNEQNIKLFIKQLAFAEKQLIRGSTYEFSTIKPVGHGQLGLIHCDLTELAMKYCSGLRIRDHLAKCGRPQNSAELAVRHQKRRRGQTSIIQTGTSSKKFVAPMRGRGFMLRNTAAVNQSNVNTTGVGMNTQLISGISSTRIDPFRSRPLNTSRPPSLHVDDFTKLEKEEHSIEEISRSTRPYREIRNSRGRGARFGIGRGVCTTHNQPTVCNLPGLSYGMKSNINQMHTNSLLPAWPINHIPISLLPFTVDSRNNSEQCRDRHVR